MERFVDIEQISDGKSYTVNDMVKIGCNDCEGCSACCHDMGGLITLDPLDVANLCEATGMSFDELSAGGHIDLIVDEGVIIPALKMDEKRNACTFLNDKGRCAVHQSRPGICRLFPMGRLYEDNTHTYFLQKDECGATLKTKVKLKAWIGISNISVYEKYVDAWHYFVKEVKESIAGMDEETVKKIDMFLLHQFYITPYSENFYGDFYSRLEKCRSVF